MSTPTNVFLAEFKELSLHLRARYLCRNFISKGFIQPLHTLIPILKRIEEIQELPTQVDQIRGSLITKCYKEVSKISHLMKMLRQLFEAL